jgi:hypothetical protein
VPEATSNVEMAEKIHHSGHPRSSPESRFHEVIEIVEAVVLAIVAVATAWSGYQASLWDGRQSELYGESSKLRITADADATMAGQQTLYDTTTFNSWIQATSSSNEKLAGLFEARFRPEYRVAFDAWMKLDPLNSPGAPPGPIFMPEYKSTLADTAKNLNEEASATFDQGTAARQRGDDYVRITVFLATVLLLTAIGQRFRFRAVRMGTLVVALALLGVGVYSILTLPRL